MDDSRSGTSPGPQQTAKAGIRNRLLQRILQHFRTQDIPFEIALPDGSVERFGEEAAKFRVTLRNERAVRAVASLDEGRIADAYLEGDIDIDGDVLPLFALRASLSDRHPLVTAWRFIQPMMVGQVKTNKRAIEAHYDIDPEFFLSLLDPELPVYTQGVYESPNDTLEQAMRRKFDYCREGCRLKPGDHVLEVGPGWGGFAGYLHEHDIKLTGLTISQVSADYLNGRKNELGADWEIILTDLYEYQSPRMYDSIVIMGVIEHLPNYKRVLDKFDSMLKPGGRIFLDGSAASKKYELSSFMVKYIYGGNHSFLVLDDFLNKLFQTKLRVLEIFNDRDSYFHTFVQWARNFDSNKDFIIEKFGEFNYRRFHLYLWGAAYEFLSSSLECYRMIIEKPGGPDELAA